MPLSRPIVTHIVCGAMFCSTCVSITNSLPPRCPLCHHGYFSVILFGLTCEALSSSSLRVLSLSQDNFLMDIDQLPMPCPYCKKKEAKVNYDSHVKKCKAGSYDTFSHLTIESIGFLFPNPSASRCSKGTC